MQARVAASNTHRNYALQGFDPSLVGTKYGSKLYIWDWDTKKLRQTLELGADGLIPLEVAYCSCSMPVTMGHDLIHGLQHDSTPRAFG